MEALFKVRYWDYSDQPFNFQGQICLGSTLAWGGLTILMTRFVHKPVEAFALWLPDQLLTAVTVLIGIYFVADFTLSFRAALDLKDVLVKMDQAKYELEKMQKRLDVIIAVTEENWENRREELDRKRERIGRRREELAEELEKRFGAFVRGTPERKTGRAVRSAFQIPHVSGAYRDETFRGQFLEAFHDFGKPGNGIEEVCRCPGRTEKIRCGL